MRELTRVAVPETDREWVEVAKGKTARQLEELVAGKAPGASRTVMRSIWAASTCSSMKLDRQTTRRRPMWVVAQTREFLAPSMDRRSTGGAEPSKTSRLPCGARCCASALRGLGFREAEVRAVLGELRAREALDAATIQDWLRAALQRLTPARQVHASRRE